MREPHAAGPMVEANRALRDQFVAALLRRDPHAATDVYAEDACLLLPSSGRIDGRPAIEAFWRAGLDAGLIDFELAPLEAFVDPAFACEVGSYRLRIEPAHESPTLEHGRYLSVLRMGPDGAWRRALEVFEPDVA